MDNVASEVRQGELLAGKYRVDRVLGAGGMGYVVACHHIHLQQKVALKFLHPNMRENQEVVGRFLREAQAAVQIRSEHVARVSDVGTLADGVPYMVMEFLEGEDLKHALETKGALPIADAVDYLLQACEALAEAHVLGIVHRDLKPDNLFLTRKADGRACVKVLDFGISKVNMASSGVSNLTGTSAMLGTPYYMAPEQLTSTRSVDARADIWALGVVLYELIAEALPFNGDTLADLCIRIVQDQPIPLPSLDRAVPPALWNVVARCLQKDREARFSNVAEVAAALAPFGTASARLSADTISRIIPIGPRGLVAVATRPTETNSEERTDTIKAEQTRVPTGNTAWGQTSASTARKSHRAPLAIGVVSGLVALGAAGWFLRATVFGSRASDAEVGSSSAAGLTSAAPPIPATHSSARAVVSDPVVVNPVASAEPNPSSPATAATAAVGREPSRTPRGAARVVQPSRIVAPDQPKRPGPSAAEQGAKVNPENLIEDRR